MIRLGDGRRADAGEVIADGVGQHEVAVRQALHEGAGAQSVGAVVGEVGLAEHVQAGDGAHQVVVHPQAAHRVVRRRIDPHGGRVGSSAVISSIHVEEVAVAVAHHVPAQALDGIARSPGKPRSPWRRRPVPSSQTDIGLAGGDVARHEVAEGWGRCARGSSRARPPGCRRPALVALLLGHPDPAVVAKALAHQRQLALVVAGLGDAGRVDLGEAGIGKEGAPLVAAPDGRGVAVDRIGGEVEDSGVAAGGQDDRVAGIALEGAGDQVAAHDAAGLPVHRAPDPASRAAGSSVTRPASTCRMRPP